MNQAKKVYRYYFVSLILTYPFVFPFIHWTVGHLYSANFFLKYVPSIIIGGIFYKLLSIPPLKKSILTGLGVYFLFEMISYFMFQDVFWGLLENCVCTQISSNWALFVSGTATFFQYHFLKQEISIQ
jgi:hypothetical protein